MKVFLVVVMLSLCAVPVLAFAQQQQVQTSAQAGEVTGAKVAVSKPGGDGNDSMNRVGRVVLVFLVLSVVFEVALTPIFNWRVFMARFDGKGYKTPITVVLAFVVFWGYGLDIIRDLLVALNYQPEGADPSVGGQILTALLIAGGSSGVFQIFTKLKIRMEPDARRTKADEARHALEQRKSAAKASGKAGP